MSNPICCGKESIENYANNNKFYYCKECKKEVVEEIKLICANCLTESCECNKAPFGQLDFWCFMKTHNDAMQRAFNQLIKGLP